MTTDTISFRLHPRVFTALGSELVTSDNVAVIELAKNSYDAGATRLDIVIRTDLSVPYMEISDNGHGMDRKTIEEVWCVVATPFRLSATSTIVDKTHSRRVSGEKGLGRLAAARLGKVLTMRTKTKDGPCWKVSVTWEDLSQANNLNACWVSIEECTPDSTLSSHGTSITITELKKEWDTDSVNELREQLARLVSPFDKSSDFSVYLTVGKEQKAQAVRIDPPAFLADPPYRLSGEVDALGRVKANYRFSDSEKPREAVIERQLWSPLIVGDTEDQSEERKPLCGPFKFEIRAWDVDAESIASLAGRFEIKKSVIRGDIRRFQGLSLYRDGVLVLPKSDAGRDWLGLDLRRISKVGGRLSTSQIVGYASITAKSNPSINDTSDRERLEDTDAARDFKSLLLSVVRLLEDERAKDREEVARQKEQPFKDLFAALSPEPLTRGIADAVERGAPAADVVPLVEDYAAGVAETVDTIERRLVQYSGLASLGTIAGMLTHEVRNHAVPIGRLCRKIRELIADKNPTALRLERSVELTEHSVAALQRLADTFAPLSNAAFRTRRRNSLLEEVIRNCLSLRDQRLRMRKASVEITPPDGHTLIAIDPGELTTVIFNLLENSLYWISFTPANRDRRIRFKIKSLKDKERVILDVDDSGPGIPPGDEERIFWPGITRKKEGLGMGLTVVSEIVTQHKGRITLITPGYLGGASFRLELPAANAHV
jgi:signal transduction histidine kinase